MISCSEGITACKIALTASCKDGLSSLAYCTYMPCFGSGCCGMLTQYLFMTLIGSDFDMVLTIVARKVCMPCAVDPKHVGRQALLPVRHRQAAARAANGVRMHWRE